MIRNISVIGAGTMGFGIALNFALYGYPVKIHDAMQSNLDTVTDRIWAALNVFVETEYITKDKIDTTLENIKLCGSLEDAVCDADYIIEAIFEDMTLKQDLFAALEKYCKDDAIIASNTSSLSLSGMLSKVCEKTRERAMVCHWYNPPHIMPLVELSFFGNMEESIFNKIYTLYESIEKIPIRVKKDIPGLIANRIQQGVAREVFSLIEMEAASTEDIDKALTFGPAFRYATAGQLEVADMGGLDIWCIVGDNLLKEMDNSKEANGLLRKKVAEGKLGAKSGEGFYKYDAEKKDEFIAQFNKRLIQQLKVCRNYL